MVTTKENQSQFKEERFEFIFYINNHIVCQRFFNIPNFNEESIVSLEIKEMLDTIGGMKNGKFGELGLIPNHLKKKSMELLWDNYNPNTVQSDRSSKYSNKKGDYFQFEVLVDKKVVGKIEFANEFYTLSSENIIDIKDIIYLIISEIKYNLSLKKYTKTNEMVEFSKERKNLELTQ